VEKDCKNWYKQLHKLRKLLPAYTNVYRECENAGDFASLKPKKDDLKDKILGLKKGVTAYRIEYRMELKRQKQRNILAKRFINSTNLKRRKHLIESPSLNPGKVFSPLVAKNIIWGSINIHLLDNPELLDILIKMEETGGEPDAIWYDEENDQFIFVG